MRDLVVGSVCEGEAKHQRELSDHSRTVHEVSEWNLDQARAEALGLDAAVQVDDMVLRFSQRVDVANQALHSATTDSVRAAARAALENLKKEQVHMLEHFDAQRAALARALP